MQACWGYINGLGARLWLLFMLVLHTHQAQGVRCRPCSKLTLAKTVNKCYLTFGGWGYSTSLECEKSQVWALAPSISEFETTGIRYSYTTKSEHLLLDVEHWMTRVVHTGWEGVRIRSIQFFVSIHKTVCQTSRSTSTHGTHTVLQVLLETSVSFQLCPLAMLHYKSLIHEMPARLGEVGVRRHWISIGDN